MVELLIAAALSVAVGVVWGLAVRAFPGADPARSASRGLSGQIAGHAGSRRFLRARLDPEKTTGLALTLALVGLGVVFVAFGVAIAMIRSDSGMVVVDTAVTRWAAVRATPFSEAAFGVITVAGSTIGVIVVALATAVYAVRRWRRWSVALFLLIVVAGQLLLANLVKIAVERVRPDAPPFNVLHGPVVPQRPHHGGGRGLGCCGARARQRSAVADASRPRGRRGRHRGHGRVLAGVPRGALDLRRDRRPAAGMDLVRPGRGGVRRPCTAAGRTGTRGARRRAAGLRLTSAAAGNASRLSSGLVAVCETCPARPCAAAEGERDGIVQRDEGRRDLRL